MKVTNEKSHDSMTFPSFKTKFSCEICQHASTFEIVFFQLLLEARFRTFKEQGGNGATLQGRFEPANLWLDQIAMIAMEKNI